MVYYSAIILNAFVSNYVKAVGGICYRRCYGLIKCTELDVVDTYRPLPQVNVCTGCVEAWPTSFSCHPLNSPGDQLDGVKYTSDETIRKIHCSAYPNNLP